MSREYIELGLFLVGVISQAAITWWRVSDLDKRVSAIEKSRTEHLLAELAEAERKQDRL